MSAVAVQIEEALVAALNAAVTANDVSMSFTATNTPQPEFDLKTLESVQVVVMTTDSVHERLSRYETQRNITVEVGVIKKVGFNAAGNIDPTGRAAMLQLAEEIGDVVAKPLTGFERAGPLEPQVAFDHDSTWFRQGIIAFGVSAEYVTTVSRRG